MMNSTPGHFGGLLAPRPLLALGVLLAASCEARQQSATTNGARNVAVEQKLTATKLAIDPSKLDPEERENLSGAACAPSGVCLLVGDEMKYARQFTIAGNTLVPDSRIFLLPAKTSDGKKTKESDAEGVAYADPYFYVIGSHSNSKSGERQPSRHFLWRIPLSAIKTGADLGAADEPSKEVDAVSLDYLIDNEPAFKSYLGHAAGELALHPDELSEDAAAGKEEKNKFTEDQHGPNIEGIAVAGDALFIGFRGPVDAGGAYVYKLPLDQLFANHRPAADVIRLPLGSAEAGVGQGVRDMAALRDGLLILTGPEMRMTIRKPADWVSGSIVPRVCSRACPRPELYFWSPGKAPRKFDAHLPDFQGDSAESLTVLGETADSIRILILADGKAGVDPMVIEVAK